MYFVPQDLSRTIERNKNINSGLNKPKTTIQNAQHPIFIDFQHFQSFLDNFINMHTYAYMWIHMDTYMYRCSIAPSFLFFLKKTTCFTIIASGCSIALSGCCFCQKRNFSVVFACLACWARLLQASICCKTMLNVCLIGHSKLGK